MCQFVSFVGYYCRFIPNVAGLSAPLVALTCKGTVLMWTKFDAFDALKSCLLRAPILGFPTESDRFVLDTDASLFTDGGVLNQIQGDREVVIVYFSGNLRLSQRQYYATRRETWPPSRCALIFVHTSVVLYSPYAQTTGPSGGSRSFAIVMTCWPDGICFWDSSRSPSNTDQGPSTLMLMAFPGSVFSVSALLVRWDRRTSLSSRPALPRL